MIETMIYRKALGDKIGSMGHDPEAVFKYLAQEYSELRKHGHHTSGQRKALREIRHEYIESLNGSTQKEEIRKLMRKYPVQFTD